MSLHTEQWVMVGLDIAAMIALVGTAPTVWRHRTSASGQVVVGLYAATGLWLVAHALEKAASTQTMKVFLSSLEYLGGMMLPLFFVMFAIRYTGRLPRLRAREWILTIPALLVVLAVWTNAWDGQYWSSFEWDPSGFLIYQRGPLFWLFIIVTYGYLLLAQGIILWSAVNLRGIYRKQLLAVFAFAMVPWLSSITYVIRVFEVPVDFTPVLCAVAAVGIGWATRRFGLLDIVPIGERAILQAISEPIVVFDDHQRLVAVNDRAQELLGVSQDQLGRAGADVVSSWSVLVDRLDRQRRSSVVNETTLVELPIDGQSRFFDMSVAAPEQGIGGVVWMFRDVTRRETAERALREQATRDPLTGLHNVRYFERRLEEALERAIASEQSVSLIMIDLDYFKDVNDRLGHVAGDQYLVEVSRYLSRLIRPADTLCRIGGDEFVIVLPGLCAEEALSESQRLLQTFQRTGPQPDGPVRIGFSCGISDFPRRAQDAAAIRIQADIALYRAKTAGRSTGSVYGDAGADEHLHL